MLGVYGESGHVNPHTQVFYVCQQYSLVFVLDMSSNMRAVVSVLPPAVALCMLSSAEQWELLRETG